MAVLPDGKIVLVADHVVRFTAAGDLDAQVCNLPVPLYNHSLAIANQPGGKLLITSVGGPEYNSARVIYTDTLVVVRLNADLSLDATFDSSGYGKVVLGFGSGRALSVSNVLLQPDGNVLVVGSSSPLRNRATGWATSNWFAWSALRRLARGKHLS